MRPRRIEIHVDELVLHGVDVLDEARLGEAVAARLEESLRRDPNGLRAADAPVVESERLTAAVLRGPALADLIATSLDGALRS